MVGGGDGEEIGRVVIFRKTENMDLENFKRLLVESYDSTPVERK